MYRNVFLNNIINSIQNHILALVVLNNKFASRKAAHLHVQHKAYKVHVKGNDKILIDFNL